MLYKFKSKTTGDVIMLQPNGQRVLEIIGKDSGGKGIILPAQMAAAITALETAIAQEEADRAAAVAQALADHEAAPRFEAISLRQRALPFIDMLRRCEKAGHEIVWGV
jgi:regulator of protease activity HflC (stomatin/prohibitin superfamily)